MKPSGRTFAAPLLALALWLIPAHADRAGDLVAAEQAYRDARAAEKAAKDTLAQAMAGVERARSEAAAAAQEQNARWDRALQAIETAKGEALALLEERAVHQVAVASARDTAREARRIYDDAVPVYQIRGRSAFLADLPEWKAIERRAADTNAELQRIVRERQPQLDEVDRRLADKRAELRRLQDAADEAARLAPADPAGAWFRAAQTADEARRAAREAEQALTRAFDAYATRLGTVRPPFLEAVSATVGNRPLYDGVWRPDRSVDDPNEQRRRDIRAALAELDPSIYERENERENLHRQRIELAQHLHPISLAIVRAEGRAADAEFDKILYTAIAEAAGTVVETAVTGGVGPALRAAETVAEKAVEDAAAKRLAGQAARAMEPEAAVAMRRLVQAGESQMASEGARLYQELEHLAHQAAVRHARQTGEALEIATLDAKRRLARALRDLQSADPAVRYEAMRAAQQAFGEKATEVANALVQASGGKFGSNNVANALLEGGSATRDVASVVLGDTIEQGIARGTAYAFATGPTAVRAAIEAARGNAGRWQQVRAGTAAFVRGSGDLRKFKEAFGGNFRGNVVAVGTTVVKAAITKHFADRQYFWAQEAGRLHWEWTTQYELMKLLLEGDRVIAGELNEAYELQAALRAYLALLDAPRRLEPTDGDAEVKDDSAIEIQLRFSTELAAPPTATLGGAMLRLQATGGAGPAAVWKASVARRDLPGDAATAALTVSLPEAASPGIPFDSAPATPARPDPRAGMRVENGRAVVAWQGLESGEDRHHTIPLRDPWSGLWARGESRIRIVRQGVSLTGRLEKAGEPGKSERGFAAGSVVLRGSVSNHRQAQLQWLARYDREWRQRCPSATAEYWANGVYTLNPAGRLAGTWDDRQLDEACKVAETVNQTDALTRVPPAP